MKKCKYISWIAVFSWMAVIFYLSHQPGSTSSHLSSDIVAALLKFIEGVDPQSTIDVEIFHTFVRKNAHFFAYFLLGLLWLNAWRSIGYHGGKQLLLGFSSSILFAITDEIHQLFINGRSGELRDVLIDGSGVGLSVVVYLAYKNLRIFRRKDNKRNLK